MEDTVVSAKSFTLCVTSLPEAARQRLDAESPLDWTTLGDPATGIELVEAVRDRRRLPEPVEVLVARLTGEVGVVPGDLAAGIERTGTASAWLGHYSIEADGESYRLRNRLDGAVLAGIRPETVAGYAVLALALATVVRETVGLWIEVGERLGAEEDPPGPMAHCATAMSGRLKALAGDDPGAVSTATLSAALEDTWNAQGLDIRAELATAVWPDPEPGACAPRPRFLAPAMSYRLHACDPGEMRWLRALAERACAPAEETGSEETALHMLPVDEPSAASEIEPEAAPDPAGPGTGAPFRGEPESDDLLLVRELAELQRTADRLAEVSVTVPAARAAATPSSRDESASLDMTALEMQIRADAAPVLEFCAGPEGSGLVEELVHLRDAVITLPDTVRRRLGESHGVGVAHAASRLRNAADGEALPGELRTATANGCSPGWLVELAATVLADAGAETASGARTGSLRLDPAESPEDGYLAFESESGIQGRLTPSELIRQVHLGLVFARQASTALAALRTAGAEGGWTLDESGNGRSGLLASERETLEAARQIQHALDRVRNALDRSDGLPTALEQAAVAAEAMRIVGPTVRAAAGWPGALGAPDPRNPEDVARMAAFAETLHEAVRSISDRQIAGGVAAAHGA